MKIATLITGEERRRSRTFMLCKVIVLCAVFAMDCCAQNIDQRYDFDIKEKTFATILSAIVEHTGMLVLYPPELANKTGMNPIVGRYTVGEAIDIMLSNTDFSGGLTKRGVIYISQKEKKYELPESSMNRKRSLLASAIAILFSSGSVSQTLDADSAPRGGDLFLEEIIVTAQKREQNLQDVPISIATISEERLDAMLDGGADIRVLAARIPSLYAEGSSGRTAPRFYIRGLGNTDFDLTASQPVSIIMDDFVMENVLLKGFPLFDIERVEVLRGPQGTLFGRNTPAGIIKFDTKKPSQELEGSASMSFGNYDSKIVQLGVGGGLTDTVSARFSLQSNERAHYVTNRHPEADFAGSGDGKPDLGGFDDLALRTQFFYEPSDEFSSLLGFQYRKLDGTTTLFRANILDVGSNELNSNFDRETVYYDGGDNNPSHVETISVNWKNEFQFDGFSLTSITGYAHGGSNGVGDIDGAAGCGFCSFIGGVSNPDIPFPVASGSSDTDIDQFTQEIRLASDTDSALSWQTGLFYFTDEFVADRARRNAIGASLPYTGSNPVAVTVVEQETDSWALFGQIGYDLSDITTITIGARYSDDERSYRGQDLNTVGTVLDTQTQVVSDDHVSWDLSLRRELSNDGSVYIRVANGFRGPSIQGKALNNVTTSDSETVNSFEVGAKFEFLDNRLRLNGSVFYYEVKDQQFTAIGGADNDNRLINAEKGVGQGFEIDAEFVATKNLFVTAGISYNETEIQDANLYVAPCSGGCSVTDPIVGLASSDGSIRNVASINGNPFPQAPEWIYSFTARYSVATENGEFFAFTDWSYQGETNYFLYESEEFNSEGNFEVGMRVGYQNFSSGYEIVLFGRNITDEENLVGGIDFNNLTGFTNEPRIYGIEASKKF